MNERERKTNDTVNEKPANNKKGITRLKYAAVSLLVRNVLILIIIATHTPFSYNKLTTINCLENSRIECWFPVSY